MEFTKRKALAGGVVVTVVGLSACAEDSRQRLVAHTPAPEPTPALEPTPVTDAIEVQAVDLFSAYQKDSLQADRQYKNKWLAVEGQVGGLSSDTITIRAGVKSGRIKCHLGNSYRQQSEQVGVGQIITVLGQFPGKGSAEGTIHWLDLAECRVESLSTPLPVAPDSITASALRAEFVADYEAAKWKFRGKKIRITGRVESVMVKWYHRKNLRFSAGVRCGLKYLTDQETRIFQALHKGQRVVMSGKVEGYSSLIDEVRVGYCELEQVLDT